MFPPVLKNFFITKKLIVNKDFDKYSLWKYLKIFHISWTKLFIIKKIRNKEIKVNGKSFNFNHKINFNDVITYRYIENKDKNIKQTIKQINLKNLKKIDVIYEDENVLIIDKDPKTSVEANEKYIYNNLQNQVFNYLNINLQNINIWKPRFIHRLDLNTTGIIICAKNFKTYTELSDDLKNKKIEKFYKVLVHGKFKSGKTIIENWIIKKDNRVFVSKKKIKNSKSAIMEIEVIEKINNFSLLKVKLITGRKHQIRALLQSEGFPVCGDRKYYTQNSKNFYNIFKFPSLCAYKIIFLNNYFKNKQNIFYSQKNWFLESEFKKKLYNL